MDQGRNAVHVRELLVRHQLPLKGPETSIEGFYNGPLWFWWKSIGYALSDGNPIAGPLVMIALNLVLTAVLMWYIAHRVSERSALFIGLSLQLFWPFYDTSRYSFNPFPLVSFAFFLILFLIKFLEGESHFFILAAIPVALSFHTELASLPPLFGLYILIGIWGTATKRLSAKTIFLSVLTFSVFFLPHLISELQSDFEQLHSIQKHLSDTRSFAAGTDFRKVTPVFLHLATESTVPQNQIISMVIVVSVIAMTFFKKTRQTVSTAFIHRLTILTLLLLILSWLWFSSTKGWHSWHTVYIPPLIFVCVLLLLFRLPIPLRIIFYSTILIAQLFLFMKRYGEYLTPGIDASLLANELKAIDWVYQKSQGKGFFVYNYLPSVNDYPYQYLFWWYGRKQYGYVPCEYSTYPNTPDLFIPGVQYYQQPKRECTNFRFLIVEPDEHQELRQQWLDDVRKNTDMVDQATIGTIEVEERRIKL